MHRLIFLPNTLFQGRKVQVFVKNIWHFRKNMVEKKH